MSNEIAWGLALGFGLGASLWLCFVRLPSMRRIHFADRIAGQLRVGRGMRSIAGGQVAAESPLGPLVKIMWPVLRDLVAALNRFNPASGGLERRLERAGLNLSITEFRISQLMYSGCGLLIGSLLVAASAAGGNFNGLLSILVLIASAVAGFVLRDWYLTEQGTKRSRRILGQFPSIAELMALAVGAGESTIGAIERVSATSKGDLADEFSSLLADIRAGTPMAAALHRMAERVDLNAMTRFVDAITVASERAQKAPAVSEGNGGPAQRSEAQFSLRNRPGELVRSARHASSNPMIITFPQSVCFTLAMLDIDSNPRSIQSMYSWFIDKKLFVNRRYQRKLVWTLTEKQKLVESILKRYPIPAILLAEREGGYEIIDGLQRLHTLMSFIETGFPGIDDKYFDISQFPTAKLQADEGLFAPAEGVATISKPDASTFLDYSLPISVMRGSTEADIDEVFSRINTYGHQLSDQERRQAGVQDDFSNLVRELAANLRGDVSADILTLDGMPSISIDLPMTKHGYSVIADDVFWVNQGILRSTDLRDSMDEQCIADIVSSIVGGQLVPRSRDALDELYTRGSQENARIAGALKVYGADKIADEIKYCVEQILSVCAVSDKKKLRDLLFEKPTTNAFPAVFTVLIIAFHEALISGRKKIANHSGLKTNLKGLSKHIQTGNSATGSEARRKNVDVIKGVMTPHLVDSNLEAIYKNHTTVDIDNVIRRSQVELPNIEFKQGIVTLAQKRKLDSSVFDQVNRTICAIANNGKDRLGYVLIGVSDKVADTNRIESLDSIQARGVGKKHVVGINREASFLGETTEAYFTRWRDAISNSTLSEPLRSDVLTKLDFNEYYGLGVIVVTVPPQKSVSYFNEEVYWRKGDQTVKASTAPAIAEAAGRF